MLVKWGRFFVRSASDWLFSAIIGLSDHLLVATSSSRIRAHCPMIIRECIGKGHTKDIDSEHREQGSCRCNPGPDDQWCFPLVDSRAEAYVFCALGAISRRNAQRANVDMGKNRIM